MCYYSSVNSGEDDMEIEKEQFFYRIFLLSQVVFNIHFTVIDFIFSVPNFISNSFNKEANVSIPQFLLRYDTKNVLDFTNVY